MIKGIGRLEPKEIKIIEEKVEKLFKVFLSGEKDKGIKQLAKLLSTQNYFVRELIGKKLAEYPNQDFMDALVLELTPHKLYGVRAAVLFYYWAKYENNPSILIMFLDSFWDNTPWEVEAIIADMWRRYPEITKDCMLRWLESPDQKQRALAFHGMENVAGEDPMYILDCVAKTIDDDSLDVQKKITHILTQLARIRPAECYPFMREWLTQSNETRQKTIWVSMKKLVNIINQRNSRDKIDEFVILTQQTINDWKNDENEFVAGMGTKLAMIMDQQYPVDFD